MRGQESLNSPKNYYEGKIATLYCAAQCKTDPTCSHWLRDHDNHCFKFRNLQVHQETYSVFHETFERKYQTDTGGSITFFGSTACQAETTSCPDGWSLYQDNCYQKFDVKKDKTSAQLTCQHQYLPNGDVSDGQLAVIPDSEAAVVLSLLVTENTYLGGKKDGSWKWEDGTLFQFLSGFDSNQNSGA